MSTILLKCLFLVVWFVHICCQDHQDRPKITALNGHLTLEAAKGKNIYFRVNGPQSGIFVQDMNLLHLRVSDSVEQYQPNDSFERINSLLKRIEGLETQINSPSDAITKNLTLLMRRVNRLNNRLSLIQSQISSRLKDECQSAPCLNGGTCLNIADGHHCLCPTNWEGLNCDVDVNECRNFAGTDLGCQNGATCINRPGTYECLCSSGWFGLHCTRRAKDCSAGNFEMCGYGTCIPVTSGEGIKCICNQGWETNGTGVACLTDVNECDSSRGPRCSVNPKVDCINLPGTFRCGQCPPGYEGDGFTCHDINECLTIPNGGCSPLVTCYNTIGSRLCGSCPPGFQGDGSTCTWRGSCNINHGGCHPSAQCVESMGMVQCTCPSGMDGDGRGIYGCYISVYGNSTQHCESNPCGVNGHCHPLLTGYTCLCREGYSGVHCDVTADYCSSHPCQNGGTCRREENSVGFRCECTAEYSGHLCQLRVKSCGGVLDAEEGSLVYPLHNNSYDHNIKCAWVIHTAPNKVINVTFSKFDLELEPECMYDFLQIHDGRTSSSQLIGRFCGNEPPKAGKIVSSHNNLYLWFRSDKSVAKEGFALHWNSIDPVCGGEINASTHGHINSPGSPGKYPPNRDCFWHLTVSLGKRIQLHFFALDIEKHANCSFDYLAIYDGERTTDPLIRKFCNSTQPPPVESSSSEILIHFHSDAYGSGNGFQLSYAPVAGVPGCGGYYTLDKGDIVSPTYNGTYLNNLLCDYRISTGPDTRIRLDFKSFKLESTIGCRFDYLKIYDGPSSDSKLVGKFCGTTYPKLYTSTTNNLFLIFKTDYSAVSDGFKITYEAVCQKLIFGDRGVVTSPGYPKHYPENTVCEYIISTTPGKAIQLTFIDFDIEDNRYVNCEYDNVEVRDGADRNATLLGKFCGGVEHIPPPQTSTHNYLYLRLNSDMSVSGTGFYANYTTIETECGGIYRETTGLIAHPSGDESSLFYNNRQKCTWLLIAPLGMVIRLNWNRFDIEKMSQCKSDYVELIEIDSSNKNESVRRYCGTSSPPALTTTTNRLMINFESDESIRSSGFSVSYTFLDERTHCGAMYVKSHGFIYSPGWPKRYEPNRDCTWTITVPVGQQIKLHISNFDLERPIRSSCDLGDYLEIRNGLSQNAPLIGKYCGSFQSRNITSLSNNVYLRFYSDFYITGTGFKIEWDGTISGCGGTLTSSSGSISSPNYPENYYENAECFYKIVTSQGSKIRLRFTDLDLERTTACKDDYVEIFDGRNEDSVSLGKYCFMKPNLNNIETTGNIAFIKFRTDAYIVKKGFMLNYDTLCETIITGKYGLIESPGYPGNYDLNLNCLWTINVPKGNKINVTFTHFAIYKSRFRYFRGNMGFRFRSDISDLNSNCDSDYLQWKETSEPQFSNKYCGTNPPQIHSTAGNSLQIKFMSGSLMSNSGFQLEWISYGCGGYSKKRVGTITMDKGIVSTGPLECEWVIESPLGTSISIQFNSLYMFGTPNCTSDVIEIFNGQSINSPLLTKICHQSSSFVQSSTNYMLIRFKKVSNLRDVFFTSNYNSWKYGCGSSIIATSGTIYSKNYPMNYDNNIDCLWTITVPKNHRVELKFTDLDLYNDDVNESCNDYIKIYQTAFITIENYTDIICPNSKVKQIVSRSNVLALQFVTDSYGSAKGFKANFTATCGAIINASRDGVIESDKSINHSNLSCLWTILAPSRDKKITLTITHLSIPNDIDIGTNRSCSSSFLRIRDGNDANSPLRGEYCGRRVPPSIMSHGSALTIELGTYGTMINGQFSAHYTPFSNACGGMLTSEEGTIASPNYPRPYPINTDCEWTLATSPGNKVYIIFETFGIQYSEGCNQDYLEVRENNSGGRLIDVYCGNEIPNNTTAASKLYLKFHSDNTESSTGFLIRYGFLHGNDIRGLDSGDIASPLYPLKYEGAADYSWRITVSSGTITVTISKLEILRREDTCSNYISFYDGYDDDASLIENVCGLLNNEDKTIVTSSNVVYIKLKLAESNNGALFLIHWRRTDSSNEILTDNTVNCGSNYTETIEPGHFVNINSPNFPNHYGHNLNCHWVFKALPGNHLILRFTSFRLEETSNCFADSISIYKADVLNEWSPIKEKICLLNDIVQTFNTSTYLKIAFVTDGTVTAKGFEARISSACGGIITNVSGIVRPSWWDWKNADNSYKIQCDWLVKVRPGRFMKLRFQEFNITNNEECSSFVILRNGGSMESPLLGSGKYCGYSHEDRLELLTLGNSLFVSYTYKNPERIFKSFKLWFEEKSEECGSTAILTADHNWEIITTPNYPSIPAPYTECIWKFTGPPGEILRVDFERVDLDKDLTCATEYIEIHDGSSEISPIRERLCGNENPGSIKTTNNALYIKYSTQKMTPNNGFKANISIDICGGTIIANAGELTSPGYPHMSTLKYASVCEWRVKGNPSFTFSFQAQDIQLPDSETACEYRITIEESLPQNNTVPILMTYCSEDSLQDSTTTVTTLTNDVTIKLHIGKPSTYSHFSVSRGFRFTFNSSIPKCGGEITTPEGYITTPNYPRDTTLRSCYWRITAPNENRRITLQFIDADIQRHRIGIYNDKSYRTLIQSIPSDDYLPSVQTFESTGNTLSIFIWLGPKSGPRHRFKAKFDSDKPALCGERFTGSSGQLTSPTLDRAYTCRWTFNYKVLETTTTNISSDTVAESLFMKVYVNSSVNNVRCRYTDPKLNIKSVLGVSVRFNRDICSYSETEFRIPASSVDFMAIKRKHSSLYFNVHWKLQPCGGIVRATEDSINIIKVPYAHNDTLDCAWIVLVPNHKRLELKLDGAFQLDCDAEFIRISPDVSQYSTPIGDYCKNRMLENSLPLKYSTLYVQYHSKPKNETNIKIFIKTIENQCGGYVMTYESMFQSPNYPKSYIGNQECTWEIKTDIGSRISLQFKGRFAIEFRPNCTKDVLILFDWKDDSYVEVARLCGRNPPPPFNSTFNKMKVLWRTDSENNLDGFQAQWTRICGGNYTATNEEQFLYSPGYPYGNGDRLECLYTIYGSNLPVVTKFIEFQLEDQYPSCSSQNLTILGESKYTYENALIYCGKEFPPTLSYEKITFTLRSDLFTSKRFKLSYKLTSCGGDIKEPSVIAIEPVNMQGHYDNNLNCTWHIEAPSNKIVVLRFLFFDLEGSYDCTNDYLAVYDGSHIDDDIRLSLICGNNKDNSSFVIRSSQNTMLINFHTDISWGGRGFKIGVFFTYSASVGCGGLINLTSTSNYQLKSPLIGANFVYENFLDCHWTIMAPNDYFIKLHFESFHIAPCQDINQTALGYNNCDCDYVDIKDGVNPRDPSINKYCGHSLPPDLSSSANSLTLVLFTDGEINSSGFEVSLSIQKSVCGQTTYYVESRTQTIKSPGYDAGSIPRGLHCVYNIILNSTLSPSPAVHINIKNLDLEAATTGSNQCDDDKLILSGPNKYRGIAPGKEYVMNLDSELFFDQAYLFYLTNLTASQTYVYCGLQKSSNLYFMNSVSLTLYTSSESANVHRGFEIDFAIANFCGKNYTETFGRIRILESYSEANLTDCYTLITAPENNTISAYFLRLTPTSWDSEPYITIHDGNTTTAKLLKKITPTTYDVMSVFSSGRNMLIYNHVAKDSYMFYDLTYVTTDKGPGCGGVLHNVVGRITSPMYPETYRRRATCEWELETPVKSRLHLRFTEFDLSIACDQVYLALVDREGRTRSRYCSETPADYTSDDNYVKVVFVTTMNNGGTGWVAEFIAVQ